MPFLYQSVISSTTVPNDKEVSRFAVVKVARTRKRACMNPYNFIYMLSTNAYDRCVFEVLEVIPIPTIKYCSVCLCTHACNDN